MDEMDKKALAVVRWWIGKNLGPGLPDYTEIIEWKGRILNNWKYTIKTDLDDRVFDVVYNGLYREWSLDVYIKDKRQKFMDETVQSEIVRKAGL